MSTPRTRPEDRGWLYHHIGRLSGVFLALVGVAFVTFLAAIGYRPALGLLIILVVGVGLIALGGRIRGT